MTTSGSDFYHDELEPEQIEVLLSGGTLTVNEVVEGLWHGQVRVRANAARGVRFLTSLPDPGEAILRIASKDPELGVRSAIIAAVASGLGSHPVAVPILFDAVTDGGEGIRDTAIQGLERRLLAGRATVMPYFSAALGDVRPAVAAVAAQLLVKAGGEAAIDALVPLLGHDDPRYRRAAYDILDRLKWGGIDALIAALREPAPRPLAAKLLSGLGEISEAQRAALEALRTAADEVGDAAFGELVAKVLSDIGRPVEVPRATPPVVPIAGFFERALEGAELGGAADVDEVLHALRDGRGFVRGNAARWLGLSEAARVDSRVAARVVDRLGPALRDADAAVRASAATALGGLGGEEAVRLVVGALADPVGAVREASIEALHGLGPEVLGAVLEAVHAAAPPVVARVFAGVRELVALHGAGAVQALADALRGGRELTALGREAACLALGDLGPAAEDAAPALLGALDDPNEDVRAAAALALGFLGVDDEIILSDLKRMLRDSVPAVRRQAALAASRITGKPLDDRSAAEPQPVPIDGFEDEVLGRAVLRDGAASAGLERLLHALRDGREIVRQNAARAIGCLAEEGAEGIERSAQPLALLLRDGDATVRRAAVDALRDLGKQAVPAAWFLTGALHDPEPTVRDAVVDVLVALYPEAEGFLVEALRTDTASAREGIFNVWYRLARDGVPSLGEALRNPSGLIRLNAAWALELLAKRGADEVLDALEDRLADPIGQVRAAALAAIDAIKGGKPRQPRVLEPEPIDVPDFDREVLERDVLAAHHERTSPERMVRALRDGRAFVRENAARMLGVFVDAGAGGDVLPSLAIALRDGAAGVRRATAEALTRVGPSAAPLLVAALDDKHKDVRAAARAGLDAMGSAALPALVEALSRAPSNRHVLPLLATLAGRAMPALVAALDGDSPLLRAGALRALRVVGREHAEVARNLVLALEGDADDLVRSEARATHDHLDGKDVAPPAAPPLPIPDAMLAGVLDADGAHAAADGVSIDVLIKASQDGREVLRANAARAIGRAAEPPKRAAMALAMLLRDGEPEVRKAAAEALELQGGAFAAPVAFWLTVALADPDPETRDRVVNVLASVHAAEPDALIEGLRVDHDLAWESILLVVDRVGAPSVPTLERGLKNPSGLIRINAAQGLELLAKRGAAEVLAALEERLADPIKQVRIAAASAIDAIKGGRPRPPRVLEPDPIDVPGFDERVVPREVLAEQRGRTTPDRMLRALRDGRAFVRENAARMLGVFAESEGYPDALEPLAIGARDAAAGVRRASLEALVHVGAAAAPVLVAGLGDKDKAVRAAASAGLEALGTAALPALIDALQRSPSDREVMPLFSTLAGRAVPALSAALAADSPLVRAGALRAMRVVGREHAEAARELVVALEADRDDFVRAEARAVHDHLDGKDIAPPAAPALPIPDAMLAGLLDADAAAAASAGTEVDVLIKACQDGREVVRANAARALGRAAEPPRRAAMALAILLRDGDAEVRKAAAEALEHLGGAFAAPVAFWLSVALADPDPGTRERIVNLLASVHAHSPEALIEGLRVDPDLAWDTVLLVVDRLAASCVPTLEAALGNPSALIRINAAQGLEHIAKRGGDAALDALELRLGDPVKQVRVAAARAIDAIKGGRPKPPKVLEPDPIDVPDFFARLVDEDVLAAHTHAVGVERLARAMRDGRPWVRANAALLLSFFPASDELTAALPGIAVLARDEANEVRRRAATALGRLVLDGRAPLAVYAPVLVRALADRAAIVRAASSQALAALGEQAFPALSLGLVDADARTLGELVPLFLALGDNVLAALPDALSPLTPELHFGALSVLKAFPREALAAHRPVVEPLAADADPRVRAAAVALLDKIDGKDVAPAAAEPTPLPLPHFADGLLEHDSLEAAANELRFDLLAHAMRDGRDVVRANAATGLEVLGSARELAWPHLMRALKDPAAEVRARAAKALAVLPPRRDIAFELVRVLDDASPRVAVAAEAALRSYGEFAVDAFMYALDDQPDIVGQTILPMLASLGPKAVDKLVLGQRYDSPLVRRNCLIGLRLLDRELARAVRPTVAQARKDEAREVRLEALATLDWIDGVEHSLLREPRPLPTPAFAEGPVSREALAAALEGYDQALLPELLFDGRRAVRENAATAFGVLSRFHPWLGIVLKDSVAAVQLAAATTLLELGDAALPSASALIAALLEDDDEVRQTAHKVLLGLGKQALPALIEGLWAPADVARKTVVPLIEALGADATPAIIDALDHPSQLVVLNALYVLGRLYGPDPTGAVKGMAKVQALVRNPLPAIIGAAQKCLFRLEGRTPAEFQKDPVPMPIVGFDKGPLAVDVLRAEAPALDVGWVISAFSDGRPLVRENAARAAGFMPKALPELLGPLTIALKDAVPEVQVAAADAFATLRAEDAVAIPALTFALRNATGRVKRACLVALDAYGPARVAAELVKHLVGREDWMLVTIGKVAARMSEVLVPALAAFAKRPDASLIARENAVRVLADLGMKARAAEPTLLSLLPDMEGMLACKAAFALGCVARPSKELIEGMQARLTVDPRPSLHHEIRQAVKILKRRMPAGATA